MPGVTADASEVEKFSKLAEKWWDETGPFKPLHQLNPVRIRYIRDKIQEHFGALEGISLLDIGCGGGLLAEPMARLGAKVTGIDASEKNIKIASLHAGQEGLPITYRVAMAEELAGQKLQFDAVLAMEVIEHVADIEVFVQACATLVKPGGLLFIATLNRTLQSYLFAIVGAEYVLRWLPVGTHEWRKFLKPSEIAARLRGEGITLKEIQGVSYNPFKRDWCLSSGVAVNFMMLGGKSKA